MHSIDQVLLANLNNLAIRPSEIELETFCMLFFRQFNLSYFDYVIQYKDNTCQTFFSDLDYAKFFLEYRIRHKIHDLPTTFLKPGKYLWQAYIPRDYLNISHNNFNFYHGLTSVNKTEDYVELFNVAAPESESSILDLYLNQYHVLELFVTSFKEQFARAYKRKQNRIILPVSEMKNRIVKSEEDHKALQQKIKSILNTRKNNYIITIQNKVVAVSISEFYCLQHLVKGYSNKVIAKKLNLSTRTVELNITNILKKTNMESRCALLANLNFLWFS